jgi:hypothetical protein
MRVLCESLLTSIPSDLETALKASKNRNPGEYQT